MYAYHAYILLCFFFSQRSPIHLSLGPFSSIHSRSLHSLSFQSVENRPVLCLFFFPSFIDSDQRKTTTTTRNDHLMAFLGKVNNLLVRRPSALAYKYLKQLSFDYRDALVETGRKLVQHPLKTLFYSSNVSLLVYAYRTLPTLHSYKNDLIQFRQQ